LQFKSKMHEKKRKSSKIIFKIFISSTRICHIDLTKQQQEEII